MNDEFFIDCLLAYIKRRIAKNISVVSSIIDDLRDMQEKHFVF